MGTRERRQREREAVRRDILDAASRIFAEEGYRRATMRRIAEEIEYSPTAIYLHFRNKDQLLQAVCEEAFSELAVTLERLRKRPATPLGYLRGCLRTYIDFGLSHRDQYIVAFMNPGQGLGNAPFGRPIGSPAFDVLRESVRACAESGAIRTADVDTTAQALWAAVHGLTSLLITMQDVALAFRQALIEHTIDTLIAGLKTPGAQAAEPAEPLVQSPAPPVPPPAQLAEPAVPAEPAAPARPAVPESPPAARQSPPPTPRARSYYLD
jgi:AcrR family transcriptional regulator